MSKINEGFKKIPRKFGIKEGYSKINPDRQKNKWGREKLSQIERTTAFVISMIERHKDMSGIGIEANRGRGVEGLKEGERVGIEKKADNYYAIVMLTTDNLVMPLRVRLDKKMYEDYLSGKPFDHKLNYDDYE